MFERYAGLVRSLYGIEVNLMPCSIAMEALIMVSLDESLSKLEERDAEVLRRRYGIGRDKETLKQVGAALGVSGPRVRVIESRAIWNLKHTSRGYPLRACLFETGLLDATSRYFDPRILFALKEKVRSGAPLSDEELEQIPVDELSFSPRTLGGLRNNYVLSLLDLRCLTKQQVLRTPNLGRRSLQEVVSVLKEYGQELSGPAV